MKYIELFAGVGGFRLGIERAFGNQGGRTEPTQEWEHEQNDVYAQGEQPEPLCVFANEWDKYAAQTYNKNFGGQIDTRDITTISTDEIPNHDLLVGGFPCQAFSVAGKRAGFNDTRGTMFFEIARILADKKPQHLLLENVKGLLSHDSGRTFQTILKVLTDLGYGVEWQVLNSKDFGVPQNRERVFIVGHLGGISGRKVFPIFGKGGNDTRVVGKEVARTIEANYYKGVSPNGHQGSGRQIVQVNQPTHSNDRVYSDEGISPTLNTMQGGARQPFVATPRIRRLTPIECERLQGFPDGWTAGVSDTQRYKQMGNAVTVNVIEAIVGRVYG